MHTIGGFFSVRAWIAIAMLLAALLLNFFFNSMDNANGRAIERIESRIAKEIEVSESQLNGVSQLISGRPSFRFSDLSLETTFPYFVFTNGRISFWSDYRYTPSSRSVSGADSISFIETSAGKFLMTKHTVSSVAATHVLVSLIPLVLHSTVTNEYLKTEYNKRIFSSSAAALDLGTEEDGYTPVKYHDRALFYIKFASGYQYSNPVLEFTIKCLVFGFILFFALAVFDFMRKSIRERTYFGGLLMLILTLFVVRGLMLFFQFPYEFIAIDIFDPKKYASSRLNPSLGDLILNLVLLGMLCLFIFSLYSRPAIFRILLRISTGGRLVLSAILVFVSYLWLSVHFQVISSLSYHSQWSMDITQNIELNYFKLASYGIFFFSGVIYFLLAHVSFKLFFHLNSLHKLRSLWVFLVGTLAFVAFSLIFQWEFYFITAVNILFYIVVAVFQLPRYIGRIQYVTFVYFFICGIPPALVASYANYQYSFEQMNYTKQRIGSQLLVENDLYAEYVLTEAAQRIRNDVFIQNRIFSPYTSKSVIEQKISRVYLSNYLDQYDIQIYTYNSRGQSFDPSSPIQDYFELRSHVEPYGTEVDGLYFINELDKSAAKRYLFFIDIKRYDQIAGYVLLSLKLKRFVPNTVYPRLLLDNRYPQQPEINDDMSYGIYRGSAVIYNYGSFNYRRDFPVSYFNDSRLYNKGLPFDGYHHFGFKSDRGQLIVVSSRNYSISRMLANFSFYFLIFIFSILMILVLLAIYTSIRKVEQNYATKIQLYLNIAFFAPLIIIGFAVLTVTVNVYKRDLEFTYLEKAEAMSSKISGTLNEYEKQFIDRERLSNQVFEIAQYAELDINLFNTSGRLIATSQPLIYENELLSGYINPEAYINIVEYRDNNTIFDENVGSLRYKNTYIAVQSFEDGSLIGILSLPFFASKEDLDRHVIRVLVNFINIFTLIFIIFLVISYLASNGLTFPLRLITQKIQKTTLSSYNEPLSWNSDDEIGLMVSEYNKMLIKLEESKKALAASEKESAWREMAQQVAHEIKNPLTPMKLNLQHIKRRIAAGEEGDQAQRERQINSLLEQVNTLSDIATSFSAFAKMPAPQSEHFELTGMLKEIISLYNKQESGGIIAELEERAFVIDGDRQWISRAISNIIINGFQAARQREDPTIIIKCTGQGRNQLLIEIRDNGEGIPPDIRDKVFLPNFSTKFSGSGIGLAMAKRAVEHAGGRIWFETEEGVGTVFFIELHTV